MIEARSVSQKILELLNEIERYENLKTRIIASTTQLFKEYQRGRYTYFEYQRLLKKYLRGKTKEGWVKYYNAYIYSLLKKIEILNSQLFNDVYQHKEPAAHTKPVDKLHLSSVKKKRITVDEKTAGEKQEKPPVKEASHDEPISKKIRLSDVEILKAPTEEGKTVTFRRRKPTLITKLKYPFRRMPEPPTRIKKREHKHLVVEAVPKAPKEKEVIKLKRRLREIISRAFHLEKGTYLGKETGVPKEVVSIRKQKLKKEEIRVEVPATVLTEEAARVKKLLEKKEGFKVYKPSLIGAIANVMIKKASFFLIDAFPEFFRYLYNALRLGNVQMLSNTYVNIMVLFSIISMILSLILFPFFFAAFGNPVGAMIVKTLMVSALVAIITFVAFYGYPFSRIRKRRVNIKANLPFGINHMAAVASSGVAPAKMFRLIAESREYGEMSVEVGKIVEYIELFGYDFLTALRSVAATNPSPQMREFLEGLIATTESGGDIKVYMTEKAKEAMLEYELERQKYTETISTYSDIYTGILIAAPLFFVATLSMVSLLGGTVGGISVDVIIVLGTYIIIPLLNTAFLLFLMMTQPEI